MEPSSTLNNKKQEVLAIISKLYPELKVADMFADTNNIVEATSVTIYPEGKSIYIGYANSTQSYTVTEYFGEDGYISFKALTLVGAIIKWINSSEEYCRSELDKVLKLKEKMVGLEIEDEPTTDADYTV